jgi:hypothetical protein
MRELAQQLAEHRIAHAHATLVGMNCEIQNVKSVLVQFVDHESNDLVVFFSDHPNAIALPQAPNEIVFIPREFETTLLDSEYSWHIASDHPTNMNAHGSWLGFHVGLLSWGKTTTLKGTNAFPAATTLTRGESGD